MLGRCEIAIRTNAVVGMRRMPVLGLRPHEKLLILRRNATSQIDPRGASLGMAAYTQQLAAATGERLPKQAAD